MIGNNEQRCRYCKNWDCTCWQNKPQTPCEPTRPQYCTGPTGPQGDPSATACQMIPYSSGFIPMILKSAGIDLEGIEDEIAKIPGVGDNIVNVIENAREQVNNILESIGLDPITGKLECDLVGNLGMGSWIPSIECNGEQGIELIQPQAYSFTACQSGTICGLNASFGNIVTLNLSGKVAYITAHVEVRPPSCAPNDEQTWVDVSPIDPKTGKQGIALINQGENAYCACGDGVFPGGALGNSYSTPGCITVPFCPDDARIHCGDMVRVTFKATPKEGTALEALLAVGFGNASLCIKPDPIDEDGCGCGCPCDSRYGTPICPKIDCGCDQTTSA